MSVLLHLCTLFFHFIYRGCLQKIAFDVLLLFFETRIFIIKIKYDLVFHALQF